MRPMDDVLITSEDVAAPRDCLSPETVASDECPVLVALERVLEPDADDALAWVADVVDALYASPDAVASLSCETVAESALDRTPAVVADDA